MRSCGIRWACCGGRGWLFTAAAVRSACASRCSPPHADPAPRLTCPPPHSPSLSTQRSGKYDGPEAERLAALRLAALSGAAYVDVELKVAPIFFAGEAAESSTQAGRQPCAAHRRASRGAAAAAEWARELPPRPPPPPSRAAKSPVPTSTRVIVSSHDYERTAAAEELEALVEACHAAGADIVKFATMANDISGECVELGVLGTAVLGSAEE